MAKRKKRFIVNHMRIYIDGSYRPSTGLGAFAILILKDNGKRLILTGTQENTTNNVMEMCALIETLKFIKEHTLDQKYEIEIFSDSEYVTKGLGEWWPKWKSNGYKTSAGKPVQNLSLWKELTSLVDVVKCKLTWIKGHAGNELHDIVDKIAFELTKAKTT